VSKITIISGSQRQNSQSLKVARFFQHSIETQIAGTAVHVIDLAANPLPLWDEDFWQSAERWQTAWGPVAAELQASDGFVIVAPEWHGMVPPALKNFFVLASSRELGHKPGLLVAVSASRGGSYPIAELKLSSNKNNRLVYVPDHVIVRDVKNVLNDGAEPASEEDRLIRERIAYSVKLLGAYASALIAVRESGLIDYKTYPFGM